MGDTLNLTVTATYSDGSTKDVTSSAIYSSETENFLSSATSTAQCQTAGTDEITVTYADGTTVKATVNITVTAVQLDSIAVTTQPTKVSYVTGEELDTTGMVITGTYNNGTTAELTGWYTSTVDMTTAGEKTVTVNYTVDGTTYKTTFTITVEESPEGLTLQKIEITTPPTKTEYLLSEELVLDGMVVTATFVNESNETVTQEIAYKPFSTSEVYGGYELDNFSMYVEKAHKMVVTYTFGGVTCTATTTINVWAEDFTDEDTSVKVHVSGDYGVTDISVAESTNTNVSNAVSGVISGTNYKAYDISLIFDTGYSETTATKTVTLPIPEGVSNPVVYFVSDDGATVSNMNATKGDGVVTFTTTHFSTYVIGESVEIKVPENETVSGSVTTGGKETKTVYMLTTSISTGNEYLIADTSTAGETANLLANNNGSVSNTTATVVSDSNGTYIVLTDATDELWTYGTVTGESFMGQSSTYNTFKNGSYYLYYESSGDMWDRTYSLDLTTSIPSSSWRYSNNRLSITPSMSRDSYYLNGGSSWSMSTSTDDIYFYVATEIEVDTTTTVSGTYKITGKDVSAVVSAPVTTDDVTTYTTANLTSTLTLMVENNEDVDDVVTDVSTTATYEIVTVDADGNTVDGDPNDIITKIENGVVYFSGNYGTALVKVSYDTNGDTDGGVVTDYITVTATAPYYTIQLHKADLTKAESYVEGTQYYIYNATTGNYQPVTITAFEDGVTYYTTPVIQGDEITSTVALKGIEAGDTYSVWAVVKEVTSTGSKDLGALGDALSWTVSDTSIATINTETGVITFTGENYGTFTVTVAYTGADGKTITDTITISATESLYVVPGDGTNDFPSYPEQGAVRFDKTATAVGNYSETGIALVELSMTGVPYSTGNNLDVLLMLDMSTSMDTTVGTDDDGNSIDRVDVTITAAKAFAKTILVNDDGTFTGNYIAIKYFNGSSVYTTTDWMTVTSDEELEALYTLIEALYTPTSSGTYYSVAMEDAYDTITTRDAASDNTQALVFMSDGGPTYYTYVDSTTTDGYSTVSNSPATIVGWFDVDDNDTSDDETDDTATPNSSFKQEYYSTQLKAVGYPVYTVGLGLANNDTGPSAFTDLTSGAHEAITSYILAQMATNSSYFYNVADSDAVATIGNVFSAIAASIKEAAKNVVVEDKIGSNYTVNFSLPTGITSDATDGIEDFYIQVVDYVLDTTTHERTGTYTVLENFTFDGETGALISHTVDGVTCTECAHVTITDGVITKIEGTYFTYEVKDDGEYLTWEAEKISSTELALQYFAYLDNSAGTDVENQIPAGTYYTNEYATLTYENYKGITVQNEFPVPQMTWNGAQVSYVFYLVNDAGQPVNRAGRVIPFAEAVYVTDVYTYSIIWNDLEQAAGLEAEYLAADKLPDAYELYDDDAAYKIHVYEKETEVNLNNHFFIGGDVTDDYNNTTTHSWTNAKTTYVFNNKSDTTKYNTVGTYVADDDDDNTNETGLRYFCKSAIIEGATYDTSVENDVIVYKVTSVGSGYQAVTGETQATVANITAAGGSTTGGTIIGDYIYYVDENGDVYTIVQKSDGNEVDKGFDFANTTVAFAVVWKPELVEDVVVVDYGLDVVIDVITNDSMAAGVVGVRTDVPSGVTTEGTYERKEEDTLTSVDVYIDANNDADGLKELKIGTATVENLNAVRFSLDKNNGMQFNEPAQFYYEADVNYYTYTTTEGTTTSTLNTTSMYSKVTVIPATTVYYEDDFLTLTSFSKSGDSWIEDEDSQNNDGKWETDGTATSATQDQDRPGESKISDALDADNNYGSDSAYETMSTYSLGSAAKITVDASTRGEATFTFYGTGFDVIGLTSNNTGTLIIQVYSGAEASGTAVKSTVVDTYYGYTKNAAGEWVTSVNDPNELYQVPVMKISDLSYGQYTAKITAGWNDYFDHVENSTSYDLYLDAIRIYDPTGNENDTANDAYVADGEGWPTYVELRNNILRGVVTAENGEVFIRTNVKEFETDKTYYVYSVSYKSVAKDAAWNETATYYTQLITYDKAEVIDVFETDVVYYTEKETYEPVEITEFEEGVTYYTKSDDEYVPVGEDAGFTAGTEYYICNIEYETVDTSSETPEEGKTYYTQRISYEKAEIQAFADGVTYYTKVEYVPANEYVQDTTYYLAELDGIVFIDCSDETAVIEDYESYGPNNELYLAPSQAIAFNAETANVADIQLGIKLANGSPVTYEINSDSYTVNTATDMYYSILKYAEAGTVTIKNVSGGILSLTNIKFTYATNPNATSTANLLWMDAESAGTALMSLRTEPAVEEEEVPETTVPDETESEQTEPEATEPEETEPETTVPEETEPEETKPTVESPDEGTMVKEIVNSIANMISSLFGWLFR